MEWGFCLKHAALLDINMHFHVSHVDLGYIILKILIRLNFIVPIAAGTDGNVYMLWILECQFIVNGPPNVNTASTTHVTFLGCIDEASFAPLR